MNDSLPLPLKKPPSRVTLSKAADSQLEAALEEVRQLRAALAVYRKLVDKLMESEVA